MISHIRRVGKSYSGPVRTLAEVEHAAILHALREYGTQRLASKALGVSEKTIYNKIVAYRKLGWATE